MHSTYNIAFKFQNNSPKLYSCKTWEKWWNPISTRYIFSLTKVEKSTWELHSTNCALYLVCCPENEKRVSLSACSVEFLKSHGLHLHNAQGCNYGSVTTLKQWNLFKGTIQHKIYQFWINSIYAMMKSLSYSNI